MLDGCNLCLVDPGRRAKHISLQMLWGTFSSFEPVASSSIVSESHQPRTGAYTTKFVAEIPAEVL